MDTIIGMERDFQGESAIKDAREHVSHVEAAGGRVVMISVAGSWSLAGLPIKLDGHLNADTITPRTVEVLGRKLSPTPRSWITIRAFFSGRTEAEWKEIDSDLEDEDPVLHRIDRIDLDDDQPTED